ncbi:MAG: DeoR/GlpR family DNA-binding transcription regulator [Alphaproteobacteria bacterium]
MTGRLRRDARFERILAELRASPAVRISALAENFGVSTETVRRDIDELSRRGLVDRTYGGAAAHPATREPAVNERYRLLVAERSRIGACAARLVEPGEVLMIDSGSTTTHFARELAVEARDLTVLTNCLGVALALGRAPGLRVILCPGDYNAREGGAFGPETAAFLERFHADKAFIGASGLTVDGPVEVDSAASWVKRRMIERSARSLLLVDETKFDARSLEIVSPLAAIDDVIADAAPPSALAEALAVADVTLHVAGAD